VIAAGSLMAATLLAAPAATSAGSYPLHPGVLEAARARVAAGDPSIRSAFLRLRAEADAALDLTPRTVMDKKTRAASGDPHDYFSLAPYWWPDPARPDGRPYIRRDGETNPESREGTDRPMVQPLGEAFDTLALAYFFTGEERYAAKAVSLLRAFFLDPATRMNPHLQYAQAIPGINDGRGIGIIEGRYLMYFYEAQPLLFDSAAWTKADEKAFREWVEAFLHWIRTSANGREEGAEKNNHGTWYDVQVGQMLLFLGHRDEAREHLAHALESRITTQIEPDGRQPYEAVRTKSFNYFLLNLTGLVRLAVLGEQVGIDAWAIETDDGRRLEKAAAFVAPYADGKREWIAKDIDVADRTRVLPLLVEAARHAPRAGFAETLERYAGTDAADARWRLFTSPPR
jgi:hypothetical protein